MGQWDGIGRIYSERMQKAVEETLQAYGRLIHDPMSWVDKWRNYGTSTACRLCRASSRGAPFLEELPVCRKCPLGRIKRYGCVDDSKGAEDTHSKLHEALCDWYDLAGIASTPCEVREEMIGNVVRAAKARSKWLKEEFKAALVPVDGEEECEA